MLKADVWRIYWLVEQIGGLPDTLKDIAAGSRHRTLDDNHGVLSVEDAAQCHRRRLNQFSLNL